MTHDGCGVHVGSLWASEIGLADGEDSGMADIYATRALAGNERQRLFRFVDGRYVCSMARTKRAYRAGKLDLAPDWDPWDREACDWSC